MRRLGDWSVQGPTSKRAKAIGTIRQQLATPLRQLLRTANPIIHSPAVVPSRWPDRINASDVDLVHLHWVQGEMLSIADIARIRKPIVWTLHDMWAFCGAEHYTTDYRWRDGYRRDNRPTHESGFDLNRHTWQRKCKHWRLPLQIVCPSQWLADCVSASSLMHAWPVEVVPYPIDLNRWQPIDQRLARQLLDLPQECPLLLFGAMGGNDPRKGIDLLLEAIAHLRSEPCLRICICWFSASSPPNRHPSSTSWCITPATCTTTSACEPSIAPQMRSCSLPARTTCPTLASKPTPAALRLLPSTPAAYPTSWPTASPAPLLNPLSQRPSRLRSAGSGGFVEAPCYRRCRTGAAERLWNPERVAGLYSDVYESAIERS